MLYGMIEEKENYRTKLSGFGVISRNKSDRELNTETMSSLFGKKRKSVLNTLKKIVKHPHAGSLKRGSESNHKWKHSLDQNAVDDNSPDENWRGGCSNKNLGWWDPPQDSFLIEFCQDTSLHGLKYVGQPHRHLSERIFWLLTFVVGLLVAGWLISEMWNKYKMNPVIVSFQPFETNVDQIPFPAVTVCNMNKVMKSQADEYIRKAKEGDPEAMKDVYYLDHVCTSTQSFSRRFNFTNVDMHEADRDIFVTNDTAYTDLTKVKSFLRKAAQNCTEMIKLCVWEDKEYIDCSSLFRPIETEFGKCCTFNMIPLSLLYTNKNDSRENVNEIQKWAKWNIDKDGLLLSPSTNESETEFPRRQMKAGKTSGLSILLNVDFDEYYCTSSDSVGFRMATHLSVELPKVADFGISVRPKSEIFVDVIPQITMADTEVFSFALDKRNCYKTGEYDLTHFKYYSLNNCIDECIANETLQMCDCKRYYMPRKQREPLCGPHKFECAEEVRYNKTKSGIRNTCPMCFQSCTDIIYGTQTTSTPLQNGIWKSTNGTGSNNWKEEDLSIVHVYIGEDSFYAKVRKELYGPTDLFANTGGLMGLCLGFSGLSLVELIYFLTFRACWKNKRKQTVVTEEHDQSKWAHASTITGLSPDSYMKRKIVTSMDGRKDEKITEPATAYYRSIFGELSVEGRK